MPDGSGRDAEFRSKLSNGISGCHCAVQYMCVK
jgi:hypothetical protein